MSFIIGIDGAVRSCGFCLLQMNTKKPVETVELVDWGCSVLSRKHVSKIDFSTTIDKAIKDFLAVKAMWEKQPESKERVPTIAMEWGPSASRTDSALHYNGYLYVLRHYLDRWKKDPFRFFMVTPGQHRYYLYKAAGINLFDVPKGKRRGEVNKNLTQELVDSLIARGAKDPIHTEVDVAWRDWKKTEALAYEHVADSFSIGIYGGAKVGGVV
jgi:hypothetical protein